MPLYHFFFFCYYFTHFNELLEKKSIVTNRFVSYVEILLSICSKFQTKRSAKFRIKPDSLTDGVLLYAAENEKTYGDFISLALRDGHVELRYSVAGSKETSIVF